MENARDIFTLIVALLTTLFGAWRLGRVPMLKWWPWPGRRNWAATCKPLPARHSMVGHTERLADRGWQGGAGVRWSGMKPQESGDWYRLHIAKPRVISHVKVRHGPDPGFPAFYSIKVKAYDEDEWEEIRGPTAALPGPIDYELSPPRKVQWLEFVIWAPSIGDDAQPYGWSIHDIELTEARLFRRLWKMIIH